ncbi:dihydroorotase [Eubacteriales bacterium OttesenSCG-928-K08]|nr:dihydroorotase [Eubacteriales bacterium OttesenSCG-928-K08]
MISAYHNARLIDASGERFGSLFVEDEFIRHIGDKNDMPADIDVEANGLVLMPALFDMHTHLRDPGFPQKETMESGMRAALKGGYATLCAMANTKPVCATAGLVLQNHKKAEELKLCRLIQAAAAGEGLKDEIPTDYEALSKATGMISNDGLTIFSDDFMRNLLLASKKHGFIISTHCQPERQIVARDIALLEEVGGNLHVGHISHRQTLALIREAKARGLKLTCEVTPHHLFGWDSDYKVNPPLRSHEDVLAMIEGIKDGTIDCLSTDHAPHTPEDKQNGMAGISNIEYALQIFLHVFNEFAIPLTRLSEMASFAPAKRMGIKTGLLKPGYFADIILLEPDGKSTLDCDTMISQSHNTPFEGRALRGRVLTTVVEGQVRYQA